MNISAISNPQALHLSFGQSPNVNSLDVKSFERIETVAVFVRISFGIADHSGLAD